MLQVERLFRRSRVLLRQSRTLLVYIVVIGYNVQRVLREMLSVRQSETNWICTVK